MVKLLMNDELEKVWKQTLRAAAHQLRQDKHHDMIQKKQKLTSAS
jgi:hypothetical protein